MKKILTIVGLFAIGYVAYLNFNFVHLKLECARLSSIETNLRYHDFRLKKDGRYEGQLKWTQDRRIKTCTDMYSFDYSNRYLIWTPWKRWK